MYLNNPQGRDYFLEMSAYNLSLSLSEKTTSVKMLYFTLFFVRDACKLPTCALCQKRDYLLQALWNLKKTNYIKLFLVTKRSNWMPEIKNNFSAKCFFWCCCFIYDNRKRCVPVCFEKSNVKPLKLIYEIQVSFSKPCLFTDFISCFVHNVFRAVGTRSIELKHFPV